MGFYQRLLMLSSCNINMFTVATLETKLLAFWYATILLKSYDMDKDW